GGGVGVGGGGLCEFGGGGGGGGGRVRGATSCDKLASLPLPNVTITLARDVAPGAFRPAAEPGADGPPPNPRAFAGLPAFCRVAATLKPSSDSDIRMEVWMPAANWNGKYEAVGNGA